MNFQSFTPLGAYLTYPVFAFLSFKCYIVLLHRNDLCDLINIASYNTHYK